MHWERLSEMCDSNTNCIASIMDVIHNAKAWKETESLAEMKE